MGKVGGEGKVVGVSGMGEEEVIIVWSGAATPLCRRERGEE